MTQISKQIRIDAPKDKVWEILADFGGVSNWAPTVVSAYSTTEANGGVGAERHCEVKRFGSIEERIPEWDEGRSYSYDVVDGVPAPMKYIRNTVSVCLDGDGTLVRFALEFEMKFGPVGALLERLAIRPLMRKTLTESLAGLKHHVETGEVIGEDTELPAVVTAA